MTTMELKEQKIFIVEGPNWTCEVQINEMNSLFPHEEQAFEAASQAVEVFKGVTNNETFALKDISESEPSMGIAVLCYLKNTDPDKTGVHVPAFVALANGGFYKDSKIAEACLIEYLVQQKKNEETSSTGKLAKEIANFEKFQQDVKSEKKSKSILNKKVKKINKKKK